MSIPLDRLYHYIESITRDVRESNVVIYRFYPYGSKKIEDFRPLKPYSDLERIILIHLYCNDQEPLDFDRYKNLDQSTQFPLNDLAKSKGIILPSVNFRDRANIYNRCLLLHSEQRGENLEKYKNSGFIPVYYWSHAMIALDWFRYANHVQQKKSVNKTFLIYNRAWSGTREYRLGFADRLIMSGLVDHILMRVSPVDSTIDKHYDLHQFEHPHWRPTNVIEKYFPLCQADSHYSADFDQEDYESTHIEVVLETLFDDLRLHLTEKTLRPIAMGQPFILAGTYGSLKYLRDYGFKTFSDCWDESYDMMSDSIERMNKIVEVMSDIVSMPPNKREEMLARAQEIADYNKQYFFSDEFQQRINAELHDNFTNSVNELESTDTCSNWIDRRKTFAEHNDLKDILTGKSLYPNLPAIKKHKKDLVQIFSVARQYYLRRLSDS